MSSKTELENCEMGKPQVDTSGKLLEPPPGLDPDCLLFLGDPQRKTYSAMTRAWMPVSAGICLGIGSVFTNVAAKMPIRAALYQHPPGFGIGEGAHRYREALASEKDIQYYHYMVLHPEDFQAPERKKYAQCSPLGSCPLKLDIIVTYSSVN
ncbi:NADH dehydrogenase [ubiquinone] 1 subunit C2 [Orchesella cincta]|uniref:NADH dehydrogenase [ubiquinone] 1 subunit C2 n=1 Tax=Orchesella cincta TaxID=48709 RepID=A0A1D2M7W2_ORCCI|nr:NADH dehydrogenase [ubiquinone] 1 subunit C2 [Orchesella cincta]